MTAPPSALSLDALRHEIDAIDDQILALLVQRFAATEKVRASKAQDGSIATSPFRPAREAQMMRRLALEAKGQVPPELLVRLWRVILSASIQSQSPVTLHMDQALAHDLGTRIMLAQHFQGMAVAQHANPGEALAAIQLARGDLAVIATSSDWVQGFAPAETGSAEVIATLPVLAGAAAPQLLLFGHAAPQPSGDDETLILLPGEEGNLSGVLWKARAGTHTIASLPGFLSPDDPQLISTLAAFPRARIAGRAPRPLKVLT